MPHRINGVQLFLKPTPHASWNRGHSGLGGRRSATPQFDALRFLESRPLRRVDECHIMQPEIRLTLLNANYLSVPLFFLLIIIPFGDARPGDNFNTLRA